MSVHAICEYCGGGDEAPNEHDRECRKYAPTTPTLTFDESTLLELTRDTTRVFTDYGGGHAGQWSYIQPFLLILYSTARYINIPLAQPGPGLTHPPRILEIGVRQGVSTMALLLACSQTNGRLTSLDIDPEETAVAARVVDAAGFTPFWDFRLTHSDAYTHPGELDLLWIDGDHQAPQPQLDFERFASLVRPGGMVLMHDYWLEDWRAETGVKQCVEAVRAAGGWEILVCPWSYGLVMLRRL